MMTAALLLSALLVGGVVWATHRLQIQTRVISARLEDLERVTSLPLYPGEPMAQRKARLFRRFQVNSPFEADNIVRDVVNLDEYGLCDEELDPDDIVVDVGAHIGVFSYLSYILGSRAVHSFEPWPENFEGLQRNLGALPGVHLFPFAVWRSDERERRPQLVLSGPDGENTGACSVLAGPRPARFRRRAEHTVTSRATRRVESVPLDEILERFERVRLLKLDCEGSEFPILLTSNQFHRVDRIVAEVHELDEAAMSRLPAGSRVSGYAAYRLADLVELLRTGGFRVRTHPTTPGIHMLDARRGPAPMHSR